MIDWTKHIIAGGVGVGHRLVQDWDANAVPPRAEAFKTYADLGTLIAVLLGLGVQVWQPRYASQGEAVSLSATPLLVQAVWKAVVEGGASKRVTYTPQRRHIPAPQGAAQRYPAPSHERQFKNVRLE